MTTIGVLGGRWRASVSPWGAIEWGSEERLDWWVAADDRWHDPAAEATIRQHRPGGVPVVETRLRVPQGDVIQRIYAVADEGGLVVCEFENDSPLPVAVAVSRRDLLSARAPSDVPAQGIELPATAAVHPIGHRASIRLAFSPERPTGGRLPAELPSATAVTRGWTAQLERASRLVLPDEALVDGVNRARAAVALEGLEDPESDPAGFLLGAHELTRLGADASDWVGELASAAEAIARRARRSGLGWDDDRALLAAACTFERAGDARAARDTLAVREATGRRTSAALADPGGIRTVAWVEDRLLRPLGADRAVVCPDGIPEPWWGSGFECHRLPAGPGRSVSYAVRWHGERPALLWDVTGPAGLELTAGGPDESWRSVDTRGEALLSRP